MSFQVIQFPAAICNYDEVPKSMTYWLSYCRPCWCDANCELEALLTWLVCSRAVDFTPTLGCNFLPQNPSLRWLIHPYAHNQCVFFDKSFCKFWYLIRKKLAQKLNAYQFTHTIYILTCSVTCEENITRQLTLYKLRGHLLLGICCWGDILEDNVNVNWHSFFVFENVTWHFEFEVEHYMKFVKRTHCQQRSCLLVSSRMTPN